MLKVSVIITTRSGGANLEKCLNSIMSQDYPRNEFEVIVIGDSLETLTEMVHKYRVKVLGVKLRPGAKRNLAAKIANGDILAFCDDDAVVHKNWLKNLLPFFISPKVAVVGGPNLTLHHATLRERCSGYIFSSFLGSAAMSARYVPRSITVREASETDLTSCNLAVKKSVLEEVGGFPEDIWPNEESILCHLVKKSGYKLMYVPNAIVWHNRRPVFIQHMRQNFRYGQGRGKMTKRHPDSVKLVHFMPLLFVLYVVAGGILSTILGQLVSSFYILTLLAYFAIALSESIRIAFKTHDYKAVLLLPLAFLLHHCSYGIGFLLGLIKKREN